MGNNVYILGAGATRELIFNTTVIDQNSVATTPCNTLGPLSTGFIFDVEQYIRALNNQPAFRDIQAFVKLNDKLWEYIKEDYYRNVVAKQGLNIADDNIIKMMVNIENLYVYVEEIISKIEDTNKQEILDHNDILIYYIKDEIINYIHSSLSAISYYSYSKLHKVLAEWVSRVGGHIISFNWDCLFEEEMFITGKWEYDDGYGIRFADIYIKESSTRARLYEARNTKSNNMVLKPHGSINWYKNINNNEICLILQQERRDRQQFGGDKLKSRETTGITKDQYIVDIIPPGNKRKGQTVEYIKIWDEIRSVIKNANQITAIGFSFNDNDKYITDEFIGIKPKNNIPVNIINPGGSTIADKYKHIFNTSNVNVSHNTFKDYCKWLITKPEMNDLVNYL